MRPRWAEIEKENPWLETSYIDYDKNKEDAKKCGVIDVLPVFIFLDKGGKELLRLKGEVSKSKIIEIINSNKDK